MSDAAGPVEMRLADFEPIGEGGTRRVYRHPLYPGSVLKRFKEPPSPGFLAVLEDAGEFQDYLVGQVRLLDVLIENGDGSRAETILCQPFLDGMHQSLSVSISYWELRPDLPASVFRLGDGRRIAEAVVESEPDAGSLREMCRDSAPFAQRLRLLYDRVHAYLDRTGMILDFAGGHNVLALRDPEWKVEVVDGLKGDGLPAAAPPGRSGPPSLWETAALLNACAFFRMIFFLEQLLSAGAISQSFADRWEAGLADLHSGVHEPNLLSLCNRHGGERANPPRG